MISVFLQTLNEEQNIDACLNCLGWSDDVVVLDSFSSDDTAEIAASYGAKVYKRHYHGRADNQNWAIKNISFKYDWIMQCDADERVSEELRKEITSIVKTDRQNSAFRLARRDMFLGKWIKHSSQYPVYLVRLYRKDSIRWSRSANPIAHIEGEVGTLKNDLVHYPFSKGYFDWVRRHNNYSSFEAIDNIHERATTNISIKNIFELDSQKRRYALKRLSLDLPLRPIVKFLYIYLVRFGFLDGRPGLTYSILLCFYEYLIVLKIEEKKKDIEREKELNEQIK